ncbi:MAG: transposase [Pseudomonadota bacterium]|nr:transposase [Pseudomonadota bacterium]
MLQLKSPYNDGTTHIVMSPLEFMQRLAVLVPRPRPHLIRFHGVLAPNAKLRAEIIPSSGRQAGNLPVPGSPGGPVNATDTSDDHGDTPHPSAPTRISWASGCSNECSRSTSSSAPSVPALLTLALIS